MFRYLPRGHEVLIVERHTQLAFACGAAVFPGGRIDDDDRRIAALPDICAIPSNVEADDAAGRIAAIRESLEETGIAIGIERLVPPEWQSWRAALHDGALFSELLQAEGVRLDLRSEEHTSELQSLMRISYAVFCLKKKTQNMRYI